MAWGSARQRSGTHGNDELAANAASLASKDWPYPVIDFYLGRRSQDEMMPAATDTDKRCESQFYLGEWYLLKDNRTEAVPLLCQAEVSCPKGFFEYAGAVTELKRFNP